MGKGLFFNIPSTGHINPAQVLISELVARGEDIVYVLPNNYREQVEQTGATFVPYPDIETLRTVNQLAQGGNIPHNAHTLVQIGEQLLPFMFKLIELEQPDYIIYDSLCGRAKMALQRFNIPTIATFSTFAFHPMAPPPMPISDIIKTAGQLLGEVREYWQTRQTIQTKHNVKSIGLFEAVACSGDLNIVYTSQKFQVVGNRFGEDYKFVGALIGERPTVPDFPYEFLEKPSLIYISLGTVNNTNIDFYRLCLKTFGDYAGHFLMSIGNQVSVDELGEIPDNFLVMNHVPQLDVLDKAKVFITHGGLNSVHESLLAGVPMIVVPQQIEQGMVANQVKKFGAGLINRRPSESSLVINLKTIIGMKSFRESAKSLGESLQSAGGVSKAVDEILKFVG